jgi:hypothetical protein
MKLQYFSIVFSVIFAIIGVIVFLIFQRKNNQYVKNETDSVDESGTNSIQIIGLNPAASTRLFLLIYSASLLSLFLGEYTKPVAYYACISLCTGILIVEIFNYRTQIQSYGILLKTAMVSINIVFANHLIYIHGISLPDLGLHFSEFVMSILNTGHLSSNPIGPYGVFSIHHLFASELTLVTGYNPLSVYLLFGSLMIAIGVLFVFLIGKRFVSFQFGLISAVLFTCLDYYLMYGEHPEHMAYIFGFALIYFTIILLTYRYQKPAFYILFAISAVALCVTHHLTIAIIFVTVCSLLFFDIVQCVQNKDRSFPSKFIFATFVVILIISTSIMGIIQNKSQIALISDYLLPYFNNLYLLLGQIFTNLIPVTSVPVTSVPVTSVPVTPVPVTSVPVTSVPVTPVPVTSVPVTSVPVTSVPVTSVPVTSVPVTPVPVTSVPVTSVPVTPVPVTPVPTISPLYGPPTAYDTLSLITLFENTLGSSLLILTAVIGFCSFIKKRSWFGDVTIINGILLSFLLGLGVLFTYVFLLPDRLYPFLQIYCLVFLGAAGVLWLYNTTQPRKRSFMIICICILIATMSFFSLASIINGFETSPFVGDNVAYQKLYTTSQDVSFGEWRTSFIQNEEQTILPLSINYKGLFDVKSGPGDSYVFFDRTILKTGIFKSGIKFGQHSFVRSIDNGQFQQFDRDTSIYDNGQVILFLKHSSR